MMRERTVAMAIRSMFEAASREASGTTTWSNATR